MFHRQLVALPHHLHPPRISLFIPVRHNAETIPENAVKNSRHLECYKIVYTARFRELPRLFSAKERIDEFSFLSGRRVQTSFPVSNRSGVDTKGACQLLLGHSVRPARCGEAFRKESGRQGKGIVVQESDDRRNVLDRGLGRVAFPVRDGRCTNPNLLGNLRLEETQVHPAGTDMVA